METKTKKIRIKNTSDLAGQQVKVCKKRKNIDISDEAVKNLSIQAIENGTNFKNHVENILEEIAKEGNEKKIKKTTTNLKLK